VDGIAACGGRTWHRDPAVVPEQGFGQMPIAALKGWTSEQKHVVAASYLGWTLDAFDFFLLVFVVTDIAREFAVRVPTILLAITLTLAMRPVGAFILGRLADRYGRRPVLMMDVLIYAALAFASAFAPNLIVFLILRALFGIAMGGEWGVGASLTMETVRPESRGVVSGILQSGYASGYLIASVAYGILFPYFGWRGLFMIGILPALLVLYIRRNVPESPGWNRERAQNSGVVDVLRDHWKLALYAILLMTCFNFLSHGTQDVYPTFLKVDHGFKPHEVSTIVVIANVGAILGGLLFGTVSQKFGRRRMIVIGALLCLPILPLWMMSQDVVPLTVGAFAMQFMVQGLLGSGAGASERAFACRSARHVSRGCPSARKLPCFVQCMAAGRSRDFAWELCLVARLRVRDRCNHAGVFCQHRTGSERRRHARCVAGGIVCALNSPG
jgi:SHS family lactate transporter-like MFS transporter